MLRATCRRTSEQRRKVIHTGVGYPPPHSMILNTVTCYARLSSKHPSTEGKSSTRGSLVHTVTWRDFPQNVRVTTEGHPPHSVKLNTVTCNTVTSTTPGYPPVLGRLVTSKHPSNDGRSTTPGLATLTHSVKLNTVTVRALPQNIRATTEGQPHRGWVHTQSNATL